MRELSERRCALRGAAVAAEADAWRASPRSNSSTNRRSDIVNTRCGLARSMVAVVQLVEHLVVVQDVAGSSPVSHPRWVRFELSTTGPPVVGVEA